jgi:hypothetical protein
VVPYAPLSPPRLGFGGQSKCATQLAAQLNTKIQYKIYIQYNPPFTFLPSPSIQKNLYTTVPSSAPFHRHQYENPIERDPIFAACRMCLGMARAAKRKRCASPRRSIRLGVPRRSTSRWRGIPRASRRVLDGRLWIALLAAMTRLITRAMR